MRRVWLLVGLVVAGAVVAAGLIVLRGRTAVHAKTSSSPVVRGNYDRFLYSITDLSTPNNKLAQFDPPLPADDSVVIPAIEALSPAAFSVTIPEGTQPAVETVNEVNDITFSVAGSKLYFELFRNSHGEVGSVRLWR